MCCVLTRPQVLGCAEKLISMIRYHVVTGARTAAQLAAAGQLPTYLGNQYPLRFEATRTGLAVTGQYSQAQTEGVPVPACASLVYKIDVLLLPARNLDSVPGGDSMAPALPPASLAVGAVTGALGSLSCGFLGSCTFKRLQKSGGREWESRKAEEEGKAKKAGGKGKAKRAREKGKAKRGEGRAKRKGRERRATQRGRERRVMQKGREGRVKRKRREGRAKQRRAVEKTKLPMRIFLASLWAWLQLGCMRLAMRCRPCGRVSAWYV